MPKHKIVECWYSTLGGPAWNMLHYAKDSCASKGQSTKTQPKQIVPGTILCIL